VSKSFIYQTLENDNGGNTNISIGDDVWGHPDEAFKGDISRVGFWGKYLSNEEINKLQGDICLSGTEEGLITAYNIDVKHTDGTKLKAVGPDKQDGTLSAEAQWKSWVESYAWTGSNGYFKSDVQDIYGLSPGEYTVVVKINGGTELPLYKCEVGLNNDLKVAISHEVAQGCEGDKLVIISIPSGGTGSYTYIWQTKEGELWKDVVGEIESQYSSPFRIENKEIRVKVTSGACPAESNSKPIEVHKKVNTQKISHKK